MSSKAACSLVWLRQDLRLADNPALSAAAKRGNPVVALYVLDDATPGKWAIGGASRWWLHESLRLLAEALQKYKVQLVLRSGAADKILPALAQEIGADAVFWNRCYEPYAIARDTQVKAALAEKSIEAESFNGSLLHEPWTILTGGKTPYKVFTPYRRAVFAAPPPPQPLPAPRSLNGQETVKSDSLADLNLLPTHPDWAGGIRKFWKPGEAQAKKRLAAFIETILSDYADKRDMAGIDKTSRLSPHLHFGEISPAQIFHAVYDNLNASGHEGVERNAEKFLSEVVWREFSTYLLYHFPHLPERAFNESFASFPFRRSAKLLQAWQHGRTGYPFVDAGMRQLWQTGWMHNRSRLVAASFLVKHLLISWQKGAEWFWDTLVDADLANNSASWQWVAGSGADAAPYFRIFNPMLQSKKFDSDGAYIRLYVPELAKLPDEYIHAPWEAPAEALSKAGITLGKTYPYPIVEHGKARNDALAAYREIR